MAHYLTYQGKNFLLREDRLNFIGGRTISRAIAIIHPLEDPLSQERKITMQIYPISERGNVSVGGDKVDLSHPRILRDGDKIILQRKDKVYDLSYKCNEHLGIN